MQLSEKDIALLVEKVKDEVSKAVQTDVAQEQSGVCTVALVPSFVPSENKALGFLIEKFGKNIEFVLFDDSVLEKTDIKAINVKTKAEKSSLIKRLVEVENVILLAPSVGMINSISRGEDEGFIESVMLRTILWGKDVHIVLDFEPPKFRRGSFFENIVLSIDALTSMGVRVSAYRVSDGAEKSGKASLVTENDILDAYNSGIKSIECEKGAIVTHLARDKAKELKISIME